MTPFNPIRRLRFAATLGVLGILLAASVARAQANPDFDSVSWTAIGCPVADLTADASPGSTNFVGDVTYPAAYYAHDASYLYFRFRMDRNVTGPGGFDQYSWTALMQVPSGNPFQYQYQLSLNGKTDTIEVWQNTVAQNIDFSPLFHDDAEVKLFSQPYDLVNGSTVNGSPLARSLPTGDGSNFNNSADYFVDFAFPVSVLVGNGLIADASDLGTALFYPATSTNPNSYNKGHLNCTFLPTTDVEIDKIVTPTAIPANATTAVTYSILAFNTGAAPARGVVLNDIALPGYMTNLAVDVTASDPSITWTVVTTNPLEVRVPIIPAGGWIMVELSADATPTCSDADFMNVATVNGTNAMDDTDTAVLVTRSAELCDGQDNDCNGLVDEGADALCDDGNPCTGTETCGGAAGCMPGTPPSCEDGNACTSDTCDPSAGCVNTATPGCVPCAVPADCNDGNPCTTESCTNGVCDPSVLIADCEPCATPADCTDDGNACTTSTCTGGVCGVDTTPGCVPCTTAADCDDQNACTTESCPAGVCVSDAIPGCVPCATDADCNDGSGCTTDSCTGGVCGSTSIPGCVPCTTAADCGDGNGCTDDTCSADGVCSNAARPGCIPCATDADCHDTNACTVDQCSADGSCMFSTIPGCVPCTTVADCDDHDACTLDACSSGMCAHQHDAQCNPREVCDDGIDNDDNGLTDCADPACAGTPACERPVEICGDCIDNDGDGLVDYDDPDCCEAPAALTLRRLMLKPTTAKVKGNRLNLRVRSTNFTPAGFDPSAQDTTLQIADANGTIFCKTVTASHWKHAKRVFRFRDKKSTFAGGLRKGKFKVKKNGQIVFRTRGKKVQLRPTDGGSVRVTLRVGNQCAQSTATLHPKRKALVFP